MERIEMRVEDVLEWQVRHARQHLEARRAGGMQ